MRGSLTKRPRKKRAGQYHHGDLRRALIDQTLRTIDKLGAEGLTLRGVGEALGVSRTEKSPRRRVPRRHARISLEKWTKSAQQSLCTI